MSEKAMENHYESGIFRWILLIILAVGAGLIVGFWLGGWYQSERLQSALVGIPDINQCY
jgi:uncharacterized protein YneF (UPF0154 family)